MPLSVTGGRMASVETEQTHDELHGKDLPSHPDGRDEVERTMMTTNKTTPTRSYGGPNGADVCT